MKLRVTTDLDGAELAKALAATAQAHGIHDHVHEVLEKSRRKELENHELWAQEAEEAWNNKLSNALREASEYVSDGVPALKKSRVPELDWSNLDNILAVADLIRDVIAGTFGALEESRRRRWEDAGLVLPDGALHPSLGDILQGGMLAARGKLPDHAAINQLRRAIAAVSWNAGERLAAKWANEHGARHIQWFASGVANEAVSTLRTMQSRTVGSMVSEMMQGKLNPRNNVGEILHDRAPVQTWRALSTELYHQFKDSEEIKRDWRRVAATETRLASNGGRLLGLEQMGVTHVAFVVHSNACAGCKRLYLQADGTPKVFELQTILDHFWSNDGLNVGRKASLIGEAGGWLPVGGPTHPFCLPGSSRVLAEGISATSKRWFNGELVVIRTSSGKNLSCTPNHPILTGGGWISAGFLNKGSHVFSSFASEWNAPISGDDQNMPPMIEEVVETFNRSSLVTTVPVPTTAEDFHGDGMDGDITIIGANRELLNGVVPLGSQFICEPSFGCGDIGEAVLDCKSAFSFFGEGLLSTLNRCVRGVNEAHAFFGGSLRHSLVHGGATIPPVHPAFYESFGDYHSRHGIEIAKRFDRFPGLVPCDNFLNRNIDSGCGNSCGSDRNAIPIQYAENSDGSNPELPLQLRDILSGKVFLDEIVSVHRIPFIGHVYNLQTEREFYIADGIVTHNCRCYPQYEQGGE